MLQTTVHRRKVKEMKVKEFYGLLDK